MVLNKSISFVSSKTAEKLVFASQKDMWECLSKTGIDYYKITAKIPESKLEFISVFQ